jgi:hypothetical protein
MRSARLCLVSGLSALAFAAGPPPAQACGGLFCSSAMPVNQAAERIIFSFDPQQRKVTAVVEILYQGPSEKFAWVLPVPGVPEIGVSTSALLDRLQAATNPTYNIQRTWDDQCGGGNRPTAGGGAGGSFATPPGPSAQNPSGPSVAVLSSGSVGPYNYDVIKVEPADSDPADVAIKWLKDNGYDVGALGPDVLRPYLRDGLNLVAFKLSKNRSAGSIRPVMLTYDDDEPMIPIRPTAVAANDDMGILVWVLGSARAVPTNYKTLEINEAVLDWFNPATSYNDVVTAAADEAGGQGFVTELASPSANLGIANTILPERGRIDQFRQTADNLPPAELVVQVVQIFSGFSGGGGFGGPFGTRSANGQVALDGVSDVLSKHLNLPAGVTVDQVLASPRCFFEQYRMPGNFYCDGKPVPPAVIDLTGFDRLKFLTDLEALVIAPLEKTAQLFRDQRYLTRLYTTMSARDMTLDPEFDLNPALADVSNAHNLALKYLDSCPGDTSGRWEAVLENGQVVPGRDGSWPYSVKANRMPVNARVVQLSATGPGRVEQDNSAKIRSALAAHAHKTGGCALAAPGESVGAGMTLLLAVALGITSALRARRRR